MSEINPKPVIGQTSVEVKQLVELLAATKIGDLLGYDAMTKAVGRDVQKQRHMLDSARRIAMRDHRCVFAPVINEGLRRLNDVETVEICSEVRRKRIRTQARNGVRELSTVTYDALPKEKQSTHNVGMAMLGALYVGSSRGEVRRLAAKVENDRPPDADGILKMVGWRS